MKDFLKSRKDLFLTRFYLLSFLWPFPIWIKYWNCRLYWWQYDSSNQRGFRNSTKGPWTRIWCFVKWFTNNLFKANPDKYRSSWSILFKGLVAFLKNGSKSFQHVFLHIGYAHIKPSDLIVRRKLSQWGVAMYFCSFNLSKWFDSKEYSKKLNHVKCDDGKQKQKFCQCFNFFWNHSCRSLVCVTMMSGKYQNNSKAGKTMIKESHKIVRKFPIISQFVPHNENKILTFKTSCHGFRFWRKSDMTILNSKTTKI